MSYSAEKFQHFIQKILPMDTAKAGVIVNFFEEKKISKNDFLTRKGKICNDFYFLAEGYVRSYTIDLKGQDITTGFYNGEEVVCELSSFFKRIPGTEDFVALSDCETLVINFEKVQRAFHGMPEFREFGRGMLINAYTGLKQRVMSSLHLTAEERYDMLIQNNPGIFQHAPLKNIASYLGVTDTSLSRIRKEYVKS